MTPDSGDSEPRITAEVGFIAPTTTAPDVYAVGRWDCSCDNGFWWSLNPTHLQASLRLICPHCGTSCELTPARA